MLKRFFSSVALIALMMIPLQEAHAMNLLAITQPIAPAQTTPVLPQPQEQIYAQISLVDYQPMKELALMPYPYALMDTYANSYDVGQCTYGVASMKKEIPNNWGNANNWLYEAKLAGYTTSSTPMVGAVGVSELGYYGHVVVVTALNADGTIQIAEMNYDGYGDGLYRTRTASISEFTYIYI